MKYSQTKAKLNTVWPEKTNVKATWGRKLQHKLQSIFACLNNNILSKIWITYVNACCELYATFEFEHFVKSALALGQEIDQQAAQLAQQETLASC